MAAPDILVIEPDTKSRATLRQVLEDLHYQPFVSGSVSEALATQKTVAPQAIIADWTALCGPVSSRVLETSDLIARMMSTIMRLQTALTSGPEAPALARRIPVIVTTDPDSESDELHAAALMAGADVYLRMHEALHERVLAPYLARYVTSRVQDWTAAASPSRRGWAPTAAPAVLETTGPDASPASGHMTDAFILRDEDLRNETSGRWDAKQIAHALGTTLTALGAAVAANYPALARTPDSEGMQERLAPFANIVAMTRDIFGQDHGKVLKWLNQPHADLGGITPLAAILQPGKATAVEQWVTHAWLGEPA